MKRSAMTATSARGALFQRRILIVEDDYFVATELATSLREDGAIVLGPVSSTDEASLLVEGEYPACVLLDINLRGRHSFDLAEQLRARGIFTIFTTGYDDEMIPPDLREFLSVRKPLDIPALIACIRNRLHRDLDS